MIGYLQIAVILIAAELLFDVPFRGNLLTLSSALVVFIVANLAMGFTFSTLARSQMQAMQMSVFYFLPSMLLSGFLFPFRGMPGWAQAISNILPLTHALRIVRGVMLKGSGWSAIWPDVWPMMLFMMRQPCSHSPAIARRWTDPINSPPRALRYTHRHGSLEAGFPGQVRAHAPYHLRRQAARLNTPISMDSDLDRKITDAETHLVVARLAIKSPKFLGEHETGRHDAGFPNRGQKHFFLILPDGLQSMRAFPQRGRRLGKISKAGRERLRTLLVVGAMSVIHFAKPRSKSASASLLQLLERKPRMPAAVALANKMARIIWAMMARGEAYRRQPVTAA